MRCFISRNTKLVIIALSLYSTFGRAEVHLESGYRIDSKILCDGLPQVQVNTLKETCMGILASKQNGLKMPRYATESREGIIYVTEMGGWAYGRGTVYALYRSKSAQGVSKTVMVNLFPKKKLTMPNGIVIDPEGRLYVGTPTAIIRFSPRDLKTGKFNIDAEVETVFNEFASLAFRRDEYKSASDFNGMDSKNKNKHPLIQMAVNKNFTEMYINIGAPSDNCGSGLKTTDSEGKCLQAEGPLASAAVWKLQFNNERQLIDYEVYSQGLRNSMALTVHPDSGLVMQGENGIDLPSMEQPYEELNILKKGNHYGWPYCYSAGEVAPEFLSKITPETCLKKYVLPKIFMPAHVAPLGLIYYHGELLANLKNKLIVSWHGYQKYGHRIVAYPVDQAGVPTNPVYQEIVSGWTALEGIRPLGAPTGLLELHDGSILVLDDKNGAILRISKGKPSNQNQEPSPSFKFSEESVRSFEPLIPFLKKNCVMCHSQFQKNNALEILKDMQGTMLNISAPEESPFFQKLKAQQMPPETIRPSLGFSDQDFKEILPLVETFINTLKH